MEHDDLLKAELSRYVYKPNTNIQITDMDILNMDLVELRKKLNEIGCTELVKVNIAARRRMLKSRGYAQGAYPREFYFTVCLLIEWIQ